MVKDDRDREKGLWTAYWASPTDENRNRLALFYQKFCELVANRFMRSKPRIGCYDRQDMIQIAFIAVLKNIPRYDPKMETEFQTFVQHRIRGDMLDEMRERDYAPRLARQRAKEGKEDVRLLFSLHHNFDKNKGDVFERTSDSWIDTIPSKDEPVPEQANHRDLREKIYKLLPYDRNLRMALRMYYYEDMTMKETGTAIELSESRISQILSGARAILRGDLDYALLT